MYCVSGSAEAEFKTMFWRFRAGTEQILERLQPGNSLVQQVFERYGFLNTSNKYYRLSQTGRSVTNRHVTLALNNCTEPSPYCY
jgi:hypothetical protein